MKKILSVVLSLCLCASFLFHVPAVNADEPGTTVNIDAAIRNNPSNFFISSGYYNPSDYIRKQENGTISIQPNNSINTISMGYQATTFLNETIRFTAKINGSTFDNPTNENWDAFYLRSQVDGYSLPDHAYGYGQYVQDKYTIEIRDWNFIRLFRTKGGASGSHTILASGSWTLGTSALTTENVYELSAINQDGYVTITVKINGVTVISCDDDSADQIRTAGYFGIATPWNNSTITIGQPDIAPSGTVNLDNEILNNPSAFVSPSTYYNPSDYIRESGSGVISFQPVNGNLAMGYQSTTYLNENIRVTAKFTGDFTSTVDNPAWDALYLRSQNLGYGPADNRYNGGSFVEDKYVLAVYADNTVGLLRQKKYVTSHVKLVSASPVGLNVAVENAYELCAVNYDGFVHITIKINGTTVLSYADASSDQIRTEGFFGVGNVLNTAVITLGQHMVESVTVDLDSEVKNHPGLFEVNPNQSASEYVRSINADNTISIRAAEGTQFSTVSMGYQGAAYLNENIRITVKFEGEFNGRWDALYLRSQGNGYNHPDGMYGLAQYVNDKYTFQFTDNGSINLLRTYGGTANHTALASASPANFDKTAENLYELSAVNCVGFVKIILKINGVAVISFDDTSADQIRDAGYFGVAVAYNNSSITIGKSETPISFTGYIEQLDSYITNVMPKTSVSDFVSHILPSSAAVTLTDSEQNELDEYDIVGTGTSVVITANGETKNYTVLIFGDVNGLDGIDIADLVSVRDNILETGSLTNIQKLAGDIYAEGEITLNSLVGLLSSVAEAGTISQMVPLFQSDTPEVLRDLSNRYSSSYTPFMFSAFVTPPPANTNNFSNASFINDAQYADISACGFNYAISGNENSGTDTLQALALAEKFGLKYYVKNTLLTSGILQSPVNELTSEYKTILTNQLRAYDGYKSFAGVYAADEIPLFTFQNAGLMADFFNILYPDKDLFINLLGMNADATITGTSNYPQYLDSYLTQTNSKMLSFDNYALMGAGSDSKSIRADHLINLEIAANAAKAKGASLMPFILTMGHWQFRTPDNYDDIAWQIYSSMAYGAKGIHPFAYWTTMSNEDTSITYGLVDKNGNKTPIYYSMQKVISEVRAMEKIYMQMNYDGTIAIQKNSGMDHPMASLQSSLTFHPRIASFDAQRDTLIGCFTDTGNNNGFLISNYADPYLDQSNTVSIQFHNARYAAVISGGQTELVELIDGLFTRTLASGQGCFVMPIK